MESTISGQLKPALPYIVGFNGPPKTGKDTIAAALMQRLNEVTHLPVYLDHLAAPMRQVAMLLTGIKTFEEYNERKDQEQELLKNWTVREFMIELSERFMKFNWGQDFWSRAFRVRHAEVWGKQPCIILVPDVGFATEVETFDNHGNFLLARVTRPGISGFGKDSRGWLWAPEQIDVHNDSTPEKAANYVLDHMVESAGWPL